jgi:PAS domain S-box-containing protein
MDRSRPASWAEVRDSVMRWMAASGPGHDAITAIAVSAAALGLRAALIPAIAERMPFITVFPVVLVASLISGMRSGFMALAILSPLCIYYFVEEHTLRMSAEGVVDTILSLLVLSLLIWVGGSQRTLRLKASSLAAEARHLAESLSRSEERYRSTVEHAPEAMFVHFDLRIVYANPSAAGLLRAASSADLMGRSPLEMVHPALREQVRERFQEMLASGRPSPPQEQRLLRLDGDEFEGETWAAPVPWDGGMAIEVIMRDISGRKRTERELSRSNADLEDFAQIVSHDLKEPLRGIGEYAAEIRKDCPQWAPQETRDKLDTLVRLSERMGSLMDSLMQYSRVGRAEMAIQDADLNTVVAGAIEGLRPIIDREQAVVELKSPLPRLRCDALRVGQVFTNLIVNALKYNQSPVKRIEIGCRAGLRRVLYVKDNGIGIAPRNHEAVFQMFRRLHPRDRYGGGTGSGLAIVKKIVDRHGGRIWLESDLGKGTIACFTLAPDPVERPIVEVPQNAPAMAPALHAGAARLRAPDPS